MAIGSGAENYSPPQHIALFERDMSPLMMYLAAPQDFVVSPSPDDELQAFLDKVGFQQPYFGSFAQSRQLLNEGFELCSWGKCRPLFRKYGLKAEAAAFDAESRRLHSRLTSLDLEKIIATIPHPEYLSSGFQPELITSSLSDEYLTTRLPFVVKSLWSSSGRGVVLVDSPSQISAVQSFIASRLRRDGAIVLEPFLNRLSECSFLFFISPKGEINYLGCNHFLADSQGRFGQELINCTYPNTLPNDWQSTASQVLYDALIIWQSQTRYTGFVGFDSMVFASKNQVRLRLCTEANLRICMGNINLVIAKFFSSKSKASWSIRHFSSPEECVDYCYNNHKSNPLRFSSDGKIESGFFRLTALDADTRFVACGFASMI